eukprot:TRINITY_DN39171_c0_g1_i1.p1 TRINITY_DN39171_c0_g1~~TRINITY_DN39171_c0_g1_i1.p1  ORF type:complete len:813 (-),score=84.18 TRINITY_DN39171_c0_g1_i1:95-2179(-)
MKRITAQQSRMLKQQAETAGIIRVIDEEFFQMMAALYASQITAGYFACLDPTEETRTGDTRRIYRCSADGTSHAFGMQILFHGTAQHRFAYLSQLLRRSEHGRLLEVGVDNGGLPAWILEREQSVEYIGVDPWFKDTEKYHSVLQKLERHILSGRARVVRGVLSDLDPQVVNPVDVVFIDGDHSYEAIVSDLRIAPSFLRPGGLVTGHDFSPWHLDIMKAVIFKAQEMNVAVHLGQNFVWWLAGPDHSNDLEQIRLPSNPASLGHVSSVMSFEERMQERARAIINHPNMQNETTYNLLVRRFQSLFLSESTRVFFELLEQRVIPPWLQTLTEERSRFVTLGDATMFDELWLYIEARERVGLSPKSPSYVPHGCCARVRIVGKGISADCPRRPEADDHFYCRSFVKPYLSVLRLALESKTRDNLFPYEFQFFMYWSDAIYLEEFGVRAQQLARSLPIFAQSAPRGSEAIVVPNNNDIQPYPSASRFLNEADADVPFEDKSDLLFWRGALSYTKPNAEAIAMRMGMPFDPCNASHAKLTNRWRLAELSVRFPALLDARVSNTCIEHQETLKVFGPTVESKGFYLFKYMISVEGSGGDDRRVAQFQRSRSLLLRLPPATMDWLQDVEIPGEHYLQLNEDMGNLVSTLEWLKAHSEAGKRIAEAGRLFSLEARSLPMTMYAFTHLVSIFAQRLPAKQV